MNNLNRIITVLENFENNVTKQLDLIDEIPDKIKKLKKLKSINDSIFNLKLILISSLSKLVDDHPNVPSDVIYQKNKMIKMYNDFVKTLTEINTNDSEIRILYEINLNYYLKNAYLDHILIAYLNFIPYVDENISKINVKFCQIKIHRTLFQIMVNG